MLAAYPMQTGKWSGSRVDECVKAYARQLARYDAAQAGEAIDECVRTSEFIPTVAAIVGALERRSLDAMPATLAWAEVQKAIGRYGHNRTPTFSNPLVSAAVAAMGWRALCKSTEGDPATRAQFRMAYESAELVAIRDGGTERLTERTSPKMIAGEGRKELPREAGVTRIDEVMGNYKFVAANGPAALLADKTICGRGRTLIACPHGAPEGHCGVDECPGG